MPARPTKPASYPVSVRQVAVLLHASFRHHLAGMPLRFANPSPPSGWIEDFHFPATEHAGHTTRSRETRAISDRGDKMVRTRLNIGCRYSTPVRERPLHPTRGHFTPEPSQTQAPVTPATEPERRAGGSLTTPTPAHQIIRADSTGIPSVILLTLSLLTQRIPADRSACSRDRGLGTGSAGAARSPSGVWAPGAPRDRRFSGRTRADTPAQAAAAIAVGDRYTGIAPAATSAARPGKSDRVAAVRRRWRSHCACLRDRA